jgi:beta-lactamase superfamily II metal-dependent hydrolase
MNRYLFAAAFAFAVSGTSVPAAANTADAPLRVIMVDVEGGAATLLVTPEGGSVLIDAGWPAGIGGPRPAPDKPAPPPFNSGERIAAAARSAGLHRIDYLVVTHYHVDHVGGLEDLLKLIPVGTVIDHGPNREQPPADANPAFASFAPAKLYAAYRQAITGREHREMRAGETFSVDALELVAVGSDRRIREFPPASPGRNCEQVTAKVEDGGEENARSLGFLLQYGQARVLAMADTTWNVENDAVCPLNRIGEVDLLIANNHGSEISNSPVFIENVSPRVALFQNGPRKGADASVFDTVRRSPRFEALWQMHSAERSAEKNEPPQRIANIAGGTDGHALHAYVAGDGAITLVNPRTGHGESYPARR